MRNAILSVKQMTEHHWTSTFAIALSGSLHSVFDHGDLAKRSDLFKVWWNI